MLIPFRAIKWLPLALLALLLAACSTADPTPDQAPGNKTIPGGSEPYPLETPLPAPTAETYPYPYPAAPTLDPNTPVTQPGYPYPEPLKPDPLSPASNPYAPQPGDEVLTRGGVGLQTVELLTLESAPPQYVLHLAGTMPTPCHQLRVQVAEPDAQKRVQVQVYSMVNPSMICTQVLVEFDASVPLSFPGPGEYTVWVNEQPAGSVTVP